jgi:hypothetical protein
LRLIVRLKTTSKFLNGRPVMLLRPAFPNMQKRLLLHGLAGFQVQQWSQNVQPELTQQLALRT